MAENPAKICIQYSKMNIENQILKYLKDDLYYQVLQYTINYNKSKTTIK